MREYAIRRLVLLMPVLLSVSVAMDKNTRKAAIQDLDGRWNSFQYHVYPLVRTFFMAYQGYVKNYRARNPAEFTRVQETWLDK